MEIADLPVTDAELAALDAHDDPVAASDQMHAITGDRPTIQIDLTDAGTIITARCGDCEVTGASADEATLALAPLVAATIREAKLQRAAQTATATVMADLIAKVGG